MYKYIHVHSCIACYFFESDGARIRTIIAEAAQLQEQFVTVLTHTKICLMKKEAKSKEFLIEFQITLTTLPLSKRYQHIHFLKEKDLIKKAKDIEEIFDILDPYWNYVDYAFLEYIIKEFGTSKLKEEMEKYIAELEQFEKRTTVQDFNAATLEKRNIPNSFIMSVTFKLFKDPAKCTLYEVFQLKIDVVNRSTLNGFTVYFEEVICNSVEIVLAFPPEAHTELLEVFDADFIATNNIVSMVFSYRAPYEDMASTTSVKGSSESLIQKSSSVQSAPSSHSVESHQASLQPVKVLVKKELPVHVYTCTSEFKHRINQLKNQDPARILISGL